MKRCTKCGELKPLTEFHRAAGTRDGYRPDCKRCNLAVKHARYVTNPRPAIERARLWAKENPERYAANQERYKLSGAKAKSNRRSHLKRKYGLTEEQYDACLPPRTGCVQFAACAPRFTSITTTRQAGFDPCCASTAMGHSATCSTTLDG